MVIIWQKSRMAYAGPCVIVQAVTLVKLCKAFGLLAQRARSARRDATDTFLQIPLQQPYRRSNHQNPRRDDQLSNNFRGQVNSSKSSSSGSWSSSRRRSPEVSRNASIRRGLRSVGRISNVFCLSVWLKCHRHDVGKGKEKK